MGRFRDSAAKDEAESEIDISSLIDCVFILLIFFIVTTVFVEETGAEIDRPQAVTGEMLEKSSILIAVTPKGEVIYGGRDVGVAGVRGIVKRLNRKESVPVIIQADTNSNAAVVVKVIDEAKLATDGSVKVSLATKINRN